MRWLHALQRIIIIPGPERDGKTAAAYFSLSLAPLPQLSWRSRRGW